MKLGHSGKKIRNTWKVLKRDAEDGGKDQSKGLCEKWSITQSQWGKEYPTYPQQPERWSHLLRDCRL
jgi:hypothetical protein